MRTTGRTWSPPRVISDTPIDDRDAGVLNLGGTAMLVSWFTSDTRKFFEVFGMNAEEIALREERLSTWTDAMVRRWLGSWIRLGDDGKTWSAP